MTKETAEKMKFVNFLRKYEQLCEEIGVHVGGCGCCDSPFMLETSEGELKNHIKHLKEIYERESFFG